MELNMNEIFETILKEIEQTKEYKDLMNMAKNIKSEKLTIFEVGNFSGEYRNTSFTEFVYLNSESREYKEALLKHKKEIELRIKSPRVKDYKKTLSYNLNFQRMIFDNKFKKEIGLK